MPKFQKNIFVISFIAVVLVSFLFAAGSKPDSVRAQGSWEGKNWVEEEFDKDLGDDYFYKDYMSFDTTDEVSGALFEWFLARTQSSGDGVCQYVYSLAACCTKCRGDNLNLEPFKCPPRTVSFPASAVGKKLVVYYQWLDTAESASGITLYVKSGATTYSVPFSGGARQKKTTTVPIPTGGEVQIVGVEMAGTPPVSSCGSPARNCAPEPNDYYAFGYMDVNTGNTCGSNRQENRGGSCVPVTKRDVSGTISWATTDASNAGATIVSKQCWADWRETGADYDFEDFFLMFSYTGTASSCPTKATNLRMRARNPALKKVRVDWNKGVGGTSQVICYSTNKTYVNGNCASGGIKKAISNPATQTYLLSNLTLNRVYYWKIGTAKSGSPGCIIWSAISKFVSSCSMSPDPLNLSVGGESKDVIYNGGNPGSGNRVDFGISPAGVATINPLSDSYYPTGGYRTTVSPVAAGTATVTGDMYFCSASAKVPCASECQATAVVNVTEEAQNAWWQVIDGDVVSRGNLDSWVPNNLYFEMTGAGGFPGVPIYKDNLNLHLGSVSQEGWVAKSAYNPTNNRMYNYDFFAKQIPADITPMPLGATTNLTGGAEVGGYYWYKFTGDGNNSLTISSAVNLGSRKVILFVENADLIINGPINLDNGQGFFMAVVKGDIFIEEPVGGSPGTGPHLEGIFIANNLFKTVVTNTQLYVRGSVAAYGGFDLLRDLGNAINRTTPAEKFEFAPDLLLLFPPKLAVRPISWSEVAP